MSGDHVNYYGDHNVTHDLHGAQSIVRSAAPAGAAEAGRAAREELGIALRELREHLDPAEAVVVDDALKVLTTDDTARPAHLHRALRVVAAVATNAGALGSPVIGLITRVLTEPARPVSAVSAVAAVAVVSAGGDEGEEARPSPERRPGVRALFTRLWDLEPGTSEHTELRGRLIRMHLPLVEHLARRYRDRKVPQEDLVRAGTEGLLKAVDRFRPDRRTSEFSTYATGLISTGIKRYLRDQGRTDRLPHRLQELHLALTTATTEFSQQHGRSPTVHELAERLAVSEQEVLEALNSANAHAALSLHVLDTEDRSPAVADALGAEGDTPSAEKDAPSGAEAAPEGIEHRDALKRLLGDLPPRQRDVVRLRYFRGMSQPQIAQEVGISQMHVARLLAGALARLGKGLPDDDPAPRARPGQCAVVLNLLDDEPRAGTLVRLTVELVAGAGHPWAERGARPLLEVVAVPLSSAEIEPATVVYRPEQRVSGEFRFRAGKPGTHPVRFAVVHHDTGVVLQQVVADLQVGTAELRKVRS
ncbi:sigma-70 family RNA polymerase sigma factor [Streptomyces sp. UH6]|uniref:sigma-70 family RNA polymerase sigma factor n=1 Tax=Streptomyces sp. UH6 TaxID=2748379 RepID=UPI0015D490BD|nr:sigma-70 family RNA polymerase sigma factor [Streptomyces sp. UH6]NYV73061.1 sigma-70 family RNA polymerase sigma factor [Streptomyces sp. UH6]